MFKLDNEFLTNLGLGNLPVEEKNRLLQMIYERLEMNVGMRLAEKMTDQQLDEFEGFIDRNDEAGALKWLETNFPNYKDVVAEELEKLKGEVRQAAPQILAAAQGQAQPGQQPLPQAAPAPQPAQPYNHEPPMPQQPYQPPTPPQPAPQPWQQPAAPAPMPGPQPYAPEPMPAQPQPAQPYQPQAPAPASPMPTQPDPSFTMPPQPAPQPPTPQAPTQQPNPQQFTPPPPGFMPGQ